MVLRIARLYCDGSFNVSSSNDLEEGRRLISGSADDADTQLVEVDIVVTRNFGAPKLEPVRLDVKSAAEAVVRAQQNGSALDNPLKVLAAALAAETA